jgi:hypothetical protein
VDVLFPDFLIIEISGIRVDFVAEDLRLQTVSPQTCLNTLRSWFLGRNDCKTFGKWTRSLSSESQRMHVQPVVVHVLGGTVPLGGYLTGNLAFPGSVAGDDRKGIDDEDARIAFDRLKRFEQSLADYPERLRQTVQTAFESLTVGQAGKPVEQILFGKLMYIPNL